MKKWGYINGNKDKVTCRLWELEENEVGFIPKLIKKKDYDDFFAKNKAARTPYIEFMLQILTHCKHTLFPSGTKEKL